LASYDYNGVKYQAEWIACGLKKPVATILVMHGDRAGYDPKDFCDGWIAQTFLAQEVEVIAVNRPGFGASTGKADFAGPQSIAAIAAGSREALQSAKSPHPISGAWGYS